MVMFGCSPGRCSHDVDAVAGERHDRLVGLAVAAVPAQDVRRALDRPAARERGLRRLVQLDHREAPAVARRVLAAQDRGDRADLVRVERVQRVPRGRAPRRRPVLIVTVPPLAVGSWRAAVQPIRRRALVERGARPNRGREVWRIYGSADRVAAVGTGPRTRLALGDLLAEGAYGLRLLSGEDGAAGRPVAGAHVVEVEAPTRFLEPEWVMLTTGVRLRGSSGAQRDLVRELAAAGASGLGFGEGVVFRRVPCALVEAGRRARLPGLRRAVRDGVPRGRPLHRELARRATRSASSGG